MLKTGLINTFLRGLTLGSKFLLLVFLAHEISPAELGIYGLMVVTITLTLYLLGLDFHNYNTREILAAPVSFRARHIRDQLAFHSVAYGIVLPLTLFVFASGTLPWRYAGWFYLLLVLEHLSQEAYRLLVTFSRSATANVVLFLRAGIWVYAVVAACLLWPGLLTLEKIFAAWAVGVAASILLAAWSFRSLDWRAVRHTPVDWDWIRRGVRVSLRLFMASICVLGVQYADRYFLQHFHGAEAVGIYTFFWQVANTMQIFVYTAVAIVLYPRLVEAFQRGDMVSYRRLKRYLVLGVVGTTVAVGAALAVGLQPVLGIVGKEVYRSHLVVGWILLAAMSFLCLSYIPNLGLYVRRLDRSIVIASAISLATALATHAVLVPRFAEEGAAWGTLISFASLAGVKSAVWWTNRNTAAVADSSAAEEIERKEESVAIGV